MNCLVEDYSTLFDVITMRPLSGPVSWRWHSVNHNVPLWNATTYIHIYNAHSTGEDKSYIKFELQKTIELQYFVLNWACLTSITCSIRASRLVGVGRHVASWGSVKLNPRLQEVMEYSIPSFLDTRSPIFCVDSRHGNIAPYPMWFA